MWEDVARRHTEEEATRLLGFDSTLWISVVLVVFNYGVLVIVIVLLVRELSR